jgi:hypothetical protein
MSGNLRNRIDFFWKEINPECYKSAYHSEGWSFMLFFHDNPNPDAIKLKIENIKENQKHSKQLIDDLFDSLMQKAFRGELVC